MPRIQPRTKILAAGALALALGTTALTQFAPQATAQSVPATAVALPRPVGPDFADLAARVAPAVVRISVIGHTEATPVDMPPNPRHPLRALLPAAPGPAGAPGSAG
ncbi:hypothetical protein ACFQY5_31870 [Paeniroseomonas aquatica]|uniref:hypothetical protein n=1 Tax=Paeniroseomonas aquatica TaxID=373043 RepID=UPI0036203E53